MQVQHIAGIAAYGLHRIGGIAFAPLCRIVDQDADARTEIHRIQVEQVERPDGEAFRGFDDKPLLAGLENVELLLFDEPFQRMAGKRRQRTADAPYLRVVFPGVHQFDISRFEGAKPCCPAFEVHQMPMILLRMSIATPHAFAFSVIFDTRNLVSLYTRLSEYLLVADLRGSMM